MSHRRDSGDMEGRTTWFQYDPDHPMAQSNHNQGRRMLFDDATLPIRKVLFDSNQWDDMTKDLE
jgi:hypothetical protein